MIVNENFSYCVIFYIMKTYLAKNMFECRNFPIMVSRAPQRSFMIPHYHDFIELVLVARGHTIHTIHSNEESKFSYGLIQGDLFTIMPGEVHGYSESRQLVIYNLAFDMKLIDNEIGELKQLQSWEALFNPCSETFRNRIHLTPFERNYAEKLMQQMIMAITIKPPGYRLNTRIAFLELLLMIGKSRPMEWKDATTSFDSKILRSINHLEKYHDRPFKLLELAKTSGMSKSSYSKKFKDMTGLSPLDYCIGLRMEKIRQQLADTDLSISEIAFQNGFCDSNYMIKLFRRWHGMTPGKYRRFQCGIGMIDSGTKPAQL